MMENKSYTRQVLMIRPNLDNLPPLCLPPYYAIHSGSKESIPAWEAICESAFGGHSDYAEKTNRPGLTSERILFVQIQGKDVATAASYDHKDYPGLGFLHMVATHKDALGKGAGRLAVLAVLHGLSAYGAAGAVLTTDDFRLPAINLYLSLGFNPVEDDEEMRCRWNAIRQKLSERRHAK